MIPMAAENSRRDSAKRFSTGMIKCRHSDRPPHLPCASRSDTASEQEPLRATHWTQPRRPRASRPAGSWLQTDAGPSAWSPSRPPGALPSPPLWLSVPSPVTRTWKLPALLHPRTVLHGQRGGRTSAFPPLVLYIPQSMGFIGAQWVAKHV